MEEPKQKSKSQKIGQFIYDYVGKPILVIVFALIGTLISYIIFRSFFELQINIVTQLINSEKDIDCKKLVKLTAIISTNSKNGTLKYKLYDELSNKDLTGEIELKVQENKNQYSIDPIKIEIEKTASIVIKYEISYDDYLALLMPSVIKEKLIDKKKTSNQVKISCVEPVEEMVFVEGGNYSKNRPSKDVNKVEGFYLDVDEVSYWDYRQFAEKTGEIVPYIQDYRAFDLDEKYGKTYPILGITWKEANQYCESMGKRLPSIKEWEYAAFGGIYSKKKNAIVYCKTYNHICTTSELEENALKIRGLTCNAIEWCNDFDAKNKNKNAVKGFQSFENDYDIYKTKFISENSDLSKIGCRCAKSLNNE